MLTSAQLERITEKHLEPKILELGFQKVRPRVFARQRRPEFIDVIALSAPFIHDRNLRAGFSLSFAPHVASRYTETVAWHRTLKSSRIDLPIPTAEGESLRINGFGPQEVAAEHARRVANALPSIESKLQQYGRVTDLLALFRWHETNKMGGFSIENRPWILMGYAFYHLRYGNEKRGEQMLSRVIKQSDFREETVARLLQICKETIANRSARLVN